jgi:ATP-dependent RNA helicase RhlE
MAPEITRITQEFLSNPQRVEVARQATTSENITQKVICFKPENRKVEGKAKRDMLRELIKQEGDKLTNGIIFCNRKVDVDIVMKSLKKHGHSVGAIHGDLDQRYRMEVLAGFKNNDITLLVASDVAARGLDIPDVTHVFNFDVPIHSEDYVHRIGRTGRAGRKGWAFMMCLPHEQKHLDGIEALVKHEIPRLEMETPKSTRPARKERPKKERAPKPEAAKPAEVKPVEAKQAEEKAPKPAQNKQENQNKKPRNPKGQGKAVKGLGDHVPAFLLR